MSKNHDWPECSGNPADCPENEGYGCCKANSPQAQGGEAFADWLAREMPPGTVISNPRWWAPRILRAIERAPQRAPGVDEAMVERAWIAVGGDRELRASDRDASRRYVERVLEAALAAPVSAGDGITLDDVSRIEFAVENMRLADPSDAQIEARWNLAFKLAETANKLRAALTSGASEVDAGLFALHLMGPDDIYAAPSYEAALRVANAVNLQFADYPVKPYAVVVPWARSAELHAAGLADWEREFNAAAPAHQGQGERGEGDG